MLLPYPLPLARLVRGLTPVPVGHGCIAETWRLIDSRNQAVFYLKRHEVGATHDSAKEAEVTRWLRGKLPVPEVVAYAADEVYHWMLLEALPGIPAHELVNEYAPGELLRVMAEGLARVRAVDIRDCPFDEPLASKLRRVRNNLDSGQLRPDKYSQGSESKAEADYLRLSSALSQSGRVFSHGDYCLPNALVRDGFVTGFLDWGEGGISDPWQDVCMLAVSLGYNYKREDRFRDFTAEITDYLGMAVPDPQALEDLRLLNELL